MQDVNLQYAFPMCLKKHFEQFLSKETNLQKKRKGPNTYSVSTTKEVSSFTLRFHIDTADETSVQGLNDFKNKVVSFALYSSIKVAELQRKYTAKKMESKFAKQLEQVKLAAATDKINSNKLLSDTYALEIQEKSNSIEELQTALNEVQAKVSAFDRVLEAISLWSGKKKKVIINAAKPYQI